MSAPVVVARAAATRTGAAAGTRAGAGRAAGAGAGRARAPRKPRAPKVSQAERERRAAAEAFEAESADPAPASEPASEPAAAPSSTTTRRSSKGSGWATSQAGAPSWYRKTVDADAVAAGNAGGGFVLGLGFTVLGLAYLRGGPDEVKRLLRSKFLNRVDP